jgi:hypothetical protein
MIVFLVFMITWYPPDFDLREELILDLSSKPTDSNSCECLGFCFLAIIQNNMATSILKRAIFMHFWAMEVRIHYHAQWEFPFSAKVPSRGAAIISILHTDRTRARRPVGNAAEILASAAVGPSGIAIRELRR